MSGTILSSSRGHILQLDLIFFDLARRPKLAEVELLPHDLPVCLTAMRRPAQCEFLRAVDGGFEEDEPDATRNCSAR
jgi:hypothetical protein